MYVGFSVRALINESNQHIRSPCPGNTMWPALIVQCLLVLSGMKEVAFLHSSDDKEEDPLAVIVKGLTALAIGIWSLTQCLSSCARDRLADSAVRLLGQGWSFLIVGVWAIGLIAMALLGCCGCLAEKCRQERRSRRRRPAPALESQVTAMEEGTGEGTDTDSSGSYAAAGSPTTVTSIVGTG